MTIRSTDTITPINYNSLDNRLGQVDAEISIGVGIQWWNSILGPTTRHLVQQSIDGLLHRSVQDQTLSIGLGGCLRGITLQLVLCLVR